MTDPSSPAANDTAEYIAFEAFRDGYARGRFHVVVNPELARRFVAQRVNAMPVTIAIVGPGIACALAGYTVIGALLVGLGIVFRRVIKWQAPKILLQLTSRQRAAYYDATTEGVMEVQRR
ncbi:MAG: hypothetical protein Q8N44_11490 [Rubrivivax sp.]|nr:hypothetical protein [Rubrivivax sp.]